MDAVIGDADDVAIAVITVAEPLVGVEMADAACRPGRQAFVDGALSAFRYFQVAARELGGWSLRRRSPA
ncbi:hypothetical protein [Streptosporangium sp. NPDC001681]|uniref:hypothetical protein n=1 Tax=Streptosporangium sp. NPDC001681 TaxID=3154395 RepID=UPI003328699C